VFTSRVCFTRVTHAFDDLSEDGYLHVLEHETQSRGGNGPIDLQRLQELRLMPYSLNLGQKYKKAANLE
jgi:hypothetical protein